MSTSPFIHQPLLINITYITTITMTREEVRAYTNRHNYANERVMYANEGVMRDAVLILVSVYALY